VPVVQRAAAQGHRIHLQVAGSRFGPFGAEGNFPAQQTARTGGGAAAVLDARGDEQPIQRGPVGLEQTLAHVGIEPALIRLVSGQPVGQARLEPHATRLEGCQPGGLERRQ
jgi:hypothetical protein